jgi:hypothetical protein
MKRIGLVALALASLTLTACPKQNEESENVTASEAQLAVSESTASNQASELTANTVELSTNFTIGGAVQAAAQELKSFILTQVPCAEITLADAKLTVKYGAKGACMYRGHQITGESTVQITSNAPGEVVVDHTWTNLSNGLVTVNGTAHVTWSATSKSRRVEHKITWTRVSDGMSGTGSGDRTQTALPGGIQEGMSVNGWRSWEGRNGRWDLSIQDVQLRWVDPCPFAGTYTLKTPKGKTLSLSFSRVDEDTIRVTVSSGKVTFKFNVNKTIGDVEQAS